MSSNQHNWAGYRMTECLTLKPVNEVCTGFLYKGFEVSMTTYNSRANMVAVYDDADGNNTFNNFRGEFDSVETAIKWCTRNKPKVNNNG